MSENVAQTLLLVPTLACSVLQAGEKRMAATTTTTRSCALPLQPRLARRCLASGEVPNDTQGLHGSQMLDESMRLQLPTESMHCRKAALQVA